MNNFDDMAKLWDQNPMRVERANTVAKAMVEKLGGKRFKLGMEYGCGTGLLGFLLKDNFDRLIMADASAGMLDVLKEKIEQTEISNMIPKQLDLLNDHVDEQFDMIFSLMVLHHVSNTNLILEKWGEILGKNGLLAIMDIDEEDGSYHPNGDTEHNGIDRKELINNLSGLGFTNITDETVYVVTKEINGELKYFPVFLVMASKNSV